MKFTTEPVAKFDRLALLAGIVFLAALLLFFTLSLINHDRMMVAWGIGVFLGIVALWRISRRTTCRICGRRMTCKNVAIPREQALEVIPELKLHSALLKAKYAKAERWESYGWACEHCQIQQVHVIENELYRRS